MNLSFLVSRTNLALADLEVNDNISYWVSAENFDLGGVTWRREQVKSPYYAGSITTGRVQDAGEARFSVDILGSSQPDVRTKLQTLIDAMTQDTFTVTLTMDAAVYKWNCEAADYALSWGSRERLHGFRPSATFTIIRQPLPISGPL